jgi:hypothetical protein
LFSVLKIIIRVLKVVPVHSNGEDGLLRQLKLCQTHS